MFIKKEEFKRKLEEVKEFGVRANNIAKLLALVSLEKDKDFWDLNEIMDLLGCNKRTANDYLKAIKELLCGRRYNNWKITIRELKEIKEEFDEENKTIRQKALRNMVFLWKYNINDDIDIMPLLNCNSITASYYSKAIDYLKRVLE